MLKIRKTIKRFVSEKKAEGFLDVAMKILIVVVIGAAVLLILNAAVPDLFSGLIDKISGELTAWTCCRNAKTRMARAAGRQPCHCRKR